MRYRLVALSAQPVIHRIIIFWRDETSKVLITYDGKSISVTSNLLDALQKFCGLENKTRLWADALCINQQDNLEKNRQVAMIATIYSNASKVFVWLGPDAYDDAPMIFADIEVLIEGLADFAIMGGKFKRFEAETCDLDRELADCTPMVYGFPTIALFEPDEEEKARFERFLRLAWLSRTWVLQEVELASQAFMLWGDTAQ
ncbi:heterokaryon incompatibility [Rhexocercosporidium sp. MPI-PUGE-AT-0058]|nr:heterokaryon incompatibility [Rhexocercosporidium sp. MPI-PUGE-AT-0058]